MAVHAKPEVVDEKDAVDRIALELGIELPPVELPDEPDSAWELWESDDLDTPWATREDEGLEDL